ncbi:MAG: hypothetical protein VX498_09410 [Myxococcota bacterium]|nr:hypothetical protein [Myxococcota bacterium]
MTIHGLRFSALLLLALLVLSACGPAYRFRPADTLPRGAVEMGAGVGVAGDTRDNSFGGMEVQAWIRGGASDRVEIGGRFWTYTFVTAGGAFDLRIQLVRGPFDLSLDGSVLVGVCCELGEDANLLSGALGFDGGFSVGKRLGGARGPAIYLSPHFQMSWTLPQEPDWPMLLSLPLGVDIPVGSSPLSLRPEFVVVGEITRDGESAWRVGGGLGLALRPPSPKKVRARRKAREKSKKEADDAALETMRKRYGLEGQKGAKPAGGEEPEGKDQAPEDDDTDEAEQIF